LRYRSYWSREKTQVLGAVGRRAGLFALLTRAEERALPVAAAS